MPGDPRQGKDLNGKIVHRFAAAKGAGQFVVDSPTPVDLCYLENRHRTVKGLRR